MPDTTQSGTNLWWIGKLSGIFPGGDRAYQVGPETRQAAAEALLEIERLRAEVAFLRMQVEAEAEFWNRHGPGADT